MYGIGDHVTRDESNEPPTSGDGPDTRASQAAGLRSGEFLSSSIVIVLAPTFAPESRCKHSAFYGTAHTLILVDPVLGSLHLLHAVREGGEGREIFLSVAELLSRAGASLTTAGVHGGMAVRPGDAAREGKTLVSSSLAIGLITCRKLTMGR